MARLDRDPVHGGDPLSRALGRALVLVLVLVAPAIPPAGAQEPAAEAGEAWIRCEARVAGVAVTCEPGGPGTERLRLDGAGAARGRLVVSWDPVSDDARALAVHVIGADDREVVAVGESPLVVELGPAQMGAIVYVEARTCGSDPGSLLDDGRDGGTDGDACPMRALRLVQDQPYGYAWTTYAS